MILWNWHLDILWNIFPSHNLHHFLLYSYMKIIYFSLLKIYNCYAFQAIKCKLSNQIFNLHILQPWLLKCTSLQIFNCWNKSEYYMTTYINVYKYFDKNYDSTSLPHNKNRLGRHLWLPFHSVTIGIAIWWQHSNFFFCVCCSGSKVEIHEFNNKRWTFLLEEKV